LDLETTGFSARMDEIIEIGAIRYSCTTEEIQEFSTLVKPNHPIPSQITGTTGITQEMVDGSGISLGEAVQKLSEFLGGRPFIGYNVNFDAQFLRCASDEQRIALTSPFFDVLQMVREVYPGLPSYSLADVARMLNLSNENAHRALGDSRRTLSVFLHIYPRVKSHYKWGLLTDLPEIQRTERSAPYEYVLNHAHRSGSFTPLEGNPAGHLCGETVVFTGDLSVSREKAIEIAVEAGCNCRDNVTRKTTILVTGRRDPSEFNGKEKSGKLEKAEELIEEGRPIRILSEAEFFEIVRNA
jgi:DNA polymerase III epsilon subunit family exonuclease